MLTMLLAAAAAAQAETEPASTDWKPTIAAAIAIISGAVAGAAVTIWVAQIQAQRAEKDRSHQRRLANEARMYEARSHTYVDLLIVGYQLREEDWRTGDPVASAGTEVPPISAAEMRKLDAQVVAHGSAEVKKLIFEWNALRKNLATLAGELAQARHHDDAAALERKRNEVREARQVAMAHVTKIEDRVQQELNQEDPLGS